MVAEQKKITGVIFSDLGKAAAFMALDWVQQALQERLDFLPYPATLNLRLEDGGDLALWQEIRREGKGIPVPPADPSFCHARLFRVEVVWNSAGVEKRVPGAVLRPEVKDYPADKVEVVSAVRLKDELGVSDGDRLTLEFVD